jgi:hypothetical protein
MTTRTKGKRLNIFANQSRKTLKHILCTREPWFEVLLKSKLNKELLFEI